MRQYSPGSERPASRRGDVRRRGRCPSTGGHSLGTGGKIVRLRGENPPFVRRLSPNRVARNWLKQEEGTGHRIPGKAAMNKRPKPKRRRFVAPVLVLGALLSSAGPATAVRAGDRDEDPEYGSTFARVRYLEGGLTLQRTGQGEVTDATLNDPVTPGDRLTTEDG